VIAGVAFGEEPIAGLPDEDDVSEQNPLTELLSDPRAQLAFMLRGRPYDRTIGAERDVYLSSHGYAALNDGAGALEGVPDNTHFPASLVSAYNVKVNLLQGGLWQASAVPGFGAVVIANPDGRHDDLLRMDWEMREVRVWLGRHQWIGPSFDRLGRIFTGAVERVTWDGSKIQLQIRDLRQLFDQEANPEAYLGFGTAVRLRAEGDKVHVVHEAGMEPADGATWLFAFEVVLEAAAQNAIIARKGDVTCRVFADGSAGLFDRGLTNWVVTPAGSFAFGGAVRLGFFAGAAGLAVYVDGLPLARNAEPLGAAAAGAALIVGRST
jgi:hypothetical protein